MSMSESMSGSSGSSDVRSIGGDVEKIKGDLAVLQRDLRGLAGKAGGVATDKGLEVRDQVQSHIEEHPFMAVGIALGAGLLLGALIARR